MVGKPSPEAAAAVVVALVPAIEALEADRERTHVLNDEALLEACKGIPRPALVESIMAAITASRATSGGVRGDVGQSSVAVSSTTRPTRPACEGRVS
jgi:hypothetical protein